MATRVLRTQVLPSGVALMVVHGDLTEETVDAIVNAANGYLSHGGGVAAAIARKAGPVLEREGDAWIEQHGRIEDGGVAFTSAGRLPCKGVIHTVGPRWKDGASGEVETLRKALENSLAMASEKNFVSIALPAISSGIFGFPKPLCAQVLVQTAIDWFASHPSTSVRTVRFTNFDAPTVQVFEEEFRRKFGEK